MRELKGTYVVCITPMDENQNIDYEVFEKNIDWFIEEGVPGVCILGGTGEFSSLSHEERVEATNRMVPYINQRIGCIVGTAAESTAETVKLSQVAEQAGADGVMIINPYYSAPTSEELISHYESVSDAIQIPIMLYNNPAHTGVDMDPPLIARLSEIKNVKYVKDATGDIKRITAFERLSNGRIQAFCGGEEVAYENFLLGATGWICVCANVIPREATKLFDLFQQDQVTEAKQLFERIFPFLEMLETKPKPIQRVKYAMELIGHPSGPPREPRKPLNDEEKAEVKNILISIQAMKEEV